MTVTSTQINNCADPALLLFAVAQVNGDITGSPYHWGDIIVSSVTTADDLDQEGISNKWRRVKYYWIWLLDTYYPGHPSPYYICGMDPFPADPIAEQLRIGVELLGVTLSMPRITGGTDETDVDWAKRMLCDVLQSE